MKDAIVGHVLKADFQALLMLVLTFLSQIPEPVETSLSPFDVEGCSLQA